LEGLNNKETKTQRLKDKNTLWVGFLKNLHPAGEAKSASVSCFQAGLCFFVALLFIP